MMSSTSADNGTPSDTAKQQEREQKCLPPCLENHLSVISKTLWFGNLSNEIQGHDIVKICLAVGEVETVDMISSSNGAIVCMSQRKSAARLMRQYHRAEFMGQCMQLVWVPSKAMKDEAWKDYWDVDKGVSYIPWEKLNKDIDYDYWEDGGMIDEDSMPEWLKTHSKNLCESKRIKTKKEESMKGEENITEGSQESLNALDFLNPQGVQFPGVQRQPNSSGVNSMIEFYDFICRRTGNAPFFNDEYDDD